MKDGTLFVAHSGDARIVGLAASASDERYLIHLSWDGVGLGFDPAANSELTSLAAFAISDPAVNLKRAVNGYAEPVANNITGHLIVDANGEPWLTVGDRSAHLTVNLQTGRIGSPGPEPPRAYYAAWSISWTPAEADETVTIFEFPPRAT